MNAVSMSHCVCILKRPCIPIIGPSCFECNKLVGKLYVKILLLDLLNE